MDGFEANAGVIIVAATNRPDVLDPALLRPGRFDRQITVSHPDIIGRDKILKVHIKKIKVSPKFDSKIIARGTPGFSGADLANLVNEAALIASRKNKRMVTLEDFEYAKDKVMLGSERRSMVIIQKDKEVIAYHEAGHALANIYSENVDPIYKSSIIPTGRALGYVMPLPVKDRIIKRKNQFEDELVVAVAARISEEIVFGAENVASGAVSDIQQATAMARQMVTEFGFSEKLGFIRYSNNQEEVFLGHSVTQSKNMSEETAKLIDEEVKRLIDDAKKKARKILIDHKDELHIVAQGLLEYETLSGDEINDLIKGIKPSRDEFDDGNSSNPVPPKPSVPKTGSTTAPQPN
jgi:cell division protease FtsH